MLVLLIINQVYLLFKILMEGFSFDYKIKAKMGIVFR